MHEDVMGKSPLLANFLCILRENEGATRRLKPLQLDSNSRGFDMNYYTTSSPSFMITVWCSCLSITTIHSPSFHLVIDGNYVNVTELSVTSIISIIIDLDKRVTCMNLWVWLGFENDVHWFFFFRFLKYREPWYSFLCLECRWIISTELYITLLG